MNLFRPEKVVKLGPHMNDSESVDPCQCEFAKDPQRFSGFGTLFRLPASGADSCSLYAHITFRVPPARRLPSGPPGWQH